MRTSSGVVCGTKRWLRSAWSKRAVVVLNGVKAIKERKENCVVQRKGKKEWREELEMLDIILDDAKYSC
jgi:hypothetical protein